MQGQSATATVAAGRNARLADGPAGAEHGLFPPVKAPGRRLVRDGYSAVMVPRSAMAEFEPDWERLADLTLEPNAFHDPAYLHAAGRHLDKGDRLAFVLVHRMASSTGRPELVGLFPVARPRPAAARLLKTWAPVYSSLGAPLVDAACAAGVIATFLAFVGALPFIGGVVFTEVATEGAFATILTAIARRNDLEVETLDPYRRAVLRSGEMHGTEPPLNAKKHKELRRLGRRLAEIGEIAFTVSTDARDVSAAVERFLELEAKGWKRRTGTALLDNEASADFTRDMTSGLARGGRCRVHEMRVGGRLVASGILIEARGRSWFWKTAYDEDFARFSPGLLLTLDITRRQHERVEIATTDSCAVEHHPMIDHVWRDRLAVGDMFVATRPRGAPVSTLALFGERTRRRVRARLKTLYHALKGA